MLECYDRFSEASWIGYTHHHAIPLRVTYVVPYPRSAARPRDTILYAGRSDHVRPSLLSWGRVDVRPLSGAARPGLRPGLNRLFD